MSTRRTTHAAPRDEKGPLTWLYQRRDKQGRPLISREEFEAGERLARDFHTALLAPRVTASWSAAASSRRQRRGPPGHGQDAPEWAATARQRLERAFRAVGGEHANLLMDVCCFEKGLGEIEREAGWPKRSGKLVLRIALRQLARHYGLIVDDMPEPGGRIRHWGTDGFRPDL